MKTRPLVTAIAIILTTVIITPSAFLLAPPRAHAIIPVFVDGTVTWPTQLQTTFQSTVSAIQARLIQANTFTSSAAEYAQYINTYVLQPLAFVLSGNLTKALTASVVAFVIGKANGTGVPQFAVDLKQTMQTVSDSAALAYLKQVGDTNSPFASSVSSALNTDYLQKSSLAGFWAANMNTLAASSPNVPAYLAGNWSQGGVAAWFSLTTQTQNNPYTLYENTQSQLGNVIGSGVGGVTGVRASQLNWGQGFMSWCGATATGSADASSGGTGGTAAASSGAAVNPGDPCTTKNGTPGIIQTPGSTIKATLDKVLGSQQDQIVRMGNAGPEINSILGNIASVMQTVQFASSILGGSGSSGGLLGSGNVSGQGRSLLGQFAPTQSSSGSFNSGYLGANASSVYQNTASFPGSGSTKASQVKQYQTAWVTINNAATAAQTSVNSLINVCTAAGGTSSGSGFAAASSAQVAAGKATLTNVIAPVLAQAAQASVVSAAAFAMIQKVQNELTAPNTDGANNYTIDMQALSVMPPSGSDIAAALQQSEVFGTASATPSGSLNVTGDSLVDQMNLISANATTLKTTVCSPSSPPYFNSSTQSP